MVTQLTQELHEAGEHQTATTDVLRIISSSQGELNAVFHGFWQTRQKLCEASYGTLWLTEGDALPRRRAIWSVARGIYGAIAARHFVSARPASPLSTSHKYRRPVQVADLRLAQAYIDREPLAVAAVELAGIYTMFTVPIFSGTTTPLAL